MAATQEQRRGPSIVVAQELLRTSPDADAGLMLASRIAMQENPRI